MKVRFFAVLILLAISAAVNAQTFRGAINGIVTDPSGAVVPNAPVKATEKATGIEHKSITTSQGQFSFQDLPQDRYKIIVAAAGSAAYSVDNIEVTAGTIYSLPVKLSLSQASTTVEVSAAALTLDTTTP